MTRFGFMVLLAAFVLAVVVAKALGGFGLSFLRALFVGINAATLLCFGYDKFLARVGVKRVPELALHLLSVCGGTPGAFAGQVLFLHKTRDRRFRLVFFTIAIVQGILLLVLKSLREG